jgi:general secretion pathway protein D
MQRAPTNTQAEYRPLPRGAKVLINLQDADLSTLIRTVGNITGKRFIVGKVHPIRATIYSPTPVNAEDTYGMFLSVLDANGLAVVPVGSYLKIVERAEVVRQPLPVYRSGS